MTDTNPRVTMAHVYDGSSVTFRVLRAFGWGPLLNLGYYPFGGALAFLNFVLSGAAYLPYYRLQVAQSALVRRSLRLARVQPGQRLLDLGCGRGASSFVAASSDPAVGVIGCDILPRNVGVADVLYRGTPNLNYVAADASRLPFADRSFDAALCIEAAFHFLDRRRFVAEMARLLNPGSRLVVVDFAWRNDDSATRAGAANVEYARRTWGWQSFETVSGYTALLGQHGFVIDSHHDWSAHVTAPLAIAMRSVSLLARTDVGRRILRVYNPLLRPLTDNDWEEFIVSTRAHTAVHQHSQYVAITATRT